MEDLNNVPSSGTYGAAINEVNANFSLIVNAINSLEYQTTRSKGILNYGTNPATAFPNAVKGDWCMILSEGNVFPATIKTFNGSTWSGSSTWNPEGLDLTGYATKDEMTAAITKAISEVKIETVDNLNEETAASGKALDAHQGFVLAGQIADVQDEVKGVGTNANGMIEALGMNTYTNIGTYTATKNNTISVPYTITKGDLFKVRVSLGAQATYLTVALKKSGTTVEYILNQVTTNQEVVFDASVDADAFSFYSKSGASSVVIDSISRNISADNTPVLGSGKTVKSNGVANYVDEHTTISESVIQDTTYTNIILDTGSISTNAGTENLYNCKRYQVVAGKDYKITSRVRGRGYHQVLFMSSNGTVTGTLYTVDKDELKITYVNHSDIPANTFYMYVNGYVNDGEAISVKADIVDIRTLAAEVPSISEDVDDLKETVYGTQDGYENISPTGTLYSNNNNYRVDYQNILKNGDVLYISCNEGYEYRAFLHEGGSVTKYYSDSYISVPSTIDYEDGDSKNLRIILKKINGTIDSESEGAANITYQAQRPLHSDGLVKRIKALFIGNSVSQDHVAYLPWLLKNMYGDDVDFKIFIAYKASATVKEYVENIITGNVNLDIFSVADNVEGWTNTRNFPYADMWTLYNNFDLICFEGYFNHGSASAGLVEDISYFMPFIEDLKSRQNKPFKLGYLMHQTYTTSTHTEADAWQRIVSGAEYAIANTPVSILFPCGVVTKLVNGDIPQSTLTNDNTHNQQGLPCIMGAYVLMEELARYLGLKSKVLNNQLRITSAKETALNIPGQNGTLQVGTDAQYSLCQDAAMKAVKYGDYLMISNSDL